MQFAQKSLGAFVRHLLVAVAMVSVVPVLLLFTGPALVDSVVTIPDETLRAALQAALSNKGAADSVTEVELATLTHLDLRGIDHHSVVSDLTGLELSICLQKLDLTISDTSANDISPLTRRANLRILELHGTSKRAA